jgi:hypothetical protein
LPWFAIFSHRFFDFIHVLSATWELFVISHAYFVHDSIQFVFDDVSTTASATAFSLFTFLVSLGISTSWEDLD